MNVKTHSRRLSKLILICFIINILSPFTVKANADTNTANWPTGGPSVVAESAIVMEANTGLILYEKNMHEKLYPASITKIMTTLLALENSSLSDVITFSRDAVFSIETGSSHIGINPGEQLTMEQALYAIMLASANEVSAGVAEYIAGSQEEFAKMMNARAKELGCQDTNFVNAHGLHNDDHYTSAYDMALISKAALQNKNYRIITGTKRYTIPETNLTTETRYLNNHHQMLYANNYPQYKYELCTGGKTGYTEMAGNTLVTYAEKDGMELICVVMKSDNPKAPANIYTDTISLLDYSFENYRLYNLAKTEATTLMGDSTLFTRFNPLFSSIETPLKQGEHANIVVPNNANLDDVQQSIKYFDQAQLKEGDNVIGSIEYTYAGKIVGSSDIIYTIENSPTLITSSDIIKKDTGKNPLQSILTKEDSERDISPLTIFFIVIIIIILLYFLLVLLQRRRRKKRYEERRRRRHLHYKKYNRFD